MAANVRQLCRPLMLFDLIPSGTMEGSEIQHAVELGGLDSTAETGEGQVNPEGDVNPRRRQRRPEQPPYGSSKFGKSWPILPSRRQCSGVA